MSTVLYFIIALSILVAIHEFGHFYVARRCGVKVLRFSIGFGPIFARWVDSKGTEFALSAIPLGGYVKMLDEREGNVPEDQLQYAYTQKTVGQRIAILLAGPLANFVLAVLLYWALFLRGVSDYAPVIGEVIPDSTAAKAGLEVGQRIIAVDGKPTPTRRDVVMRLMGRLGETGELHFTVQYPESSLRYDTYALIEDWEKGNEIPSPLESLGIEFYFPEISAEIAQVVEGSAAAKGGIKAGDRIVSAAGTELDNWKTLVSIIQANPERDIDIEVQRDGQILALKVRPGARIDDEGRRVGHLGVGPKLPKMPPDMVAKQTFGPIGAAGEAVKETWETSGFVLLSLKKLILGQISTKNLSGPIGIAKVAGDSARAGIWAFVSFLAMISVYLGVLNLLPIPVLDGGHIVYCLVEWVKGSPVSERIQILGHQAGLVVILGVMVIAFYNDILRL